jgi:hypothetical protein
VENVVEGRDIDLSLKRDQFAERTSQLFRRVVIV